MTELSLHRSFWDYHKVQIAVGALIRDRRSFMNLQKSVAHIWMLARTNFGPVRYQSWTTHGSASKDVCCRTSHRGLPLPDHSCGGIFSEHCIEQLPKREHSRYLPKWTAC